MNLGTAFGILSAAVLLESSPFPQNTDEKSLVASVIINRFAIVNGFLNLEVNGSLWGAASPDPNTIPDDSWAPAAFGWANGSLAGIVGYPGQFATFQASGPGQTTAVIAASAIGNFNDAMASDSGSAQCRNVESSISAAYFGLQEVSSGARGLTANGYLPTSFNSFSRPNRSLGFESAVPVDLPNTRNRFYGIPISQVRVNGSPNVVTADIYKKKPRGRDKGPRIRAGY